METKRIRWTVYEILKTLSNLNPIFIKDIIICHQMLLVRHIVYIYIHTQNTTMFENKSLGLLVQTYGTLSSIWDGAFYENS